MKKLIALIMCICLVVCLSGCGYNTREINTENNDNRMKLIYNDGFCLIYVDNETGCQYFSRGSTSGVCLMVDENGNPLIYEMEGDKNESIHN